MASVVKKIMLAEEVGTTEAKIIPEVSRHTKIINLINFFTLHFLELERA
jgi:hypothetical protein